MGRRRVQAVSSELFTYVPDTHTMAVERSTLGEFNTQQPIYDDACDTGFAIRSKRTGKVITFYEASMCREPEGDIQYWDFRVIPEEEHLFPQLKQLLVRVFND